MKVYVVVAIATMLVFVFWNQNRSTKNSAKTDHENSAPLVQQTAIPEPHETTQAKARDVAATGRSDKSNDDSKQDKSGSSGQIDSESEFERRYPGKWRFRKRDGRFIQSITGGLIPDVGKNQESVLKFANEISPLLAQGRYDLAGEARVFASTERLNSYQVDQFAQGFKVYQGSMQVIARAQDGAAYIVNNQLKDIQSFNNSPSLTANEAIALVQKKYENATLKAPDSPQVFSSEQHGTRLAWVIDLHQTAPKNSHRDIVVAADNGEILYEEEFVIHD